MIIDKNVIDVNLNAEDFLQYLDRWLGWRFVIKAGKKTKVPITRSGYNASVSDPKTWMPYREATALEQIDGTGIVLGDLGTGVYLCGIDLDSCLSAGGDLLPFGYDVIERFPTAYVEISPSGTGVKLFFLVQPADIPAVRTALGSNSKTWKLPDGGNHGPAIEFYLAKRFFTVTWNKFSLSADEVGIADSDALLWLIREFGPAFAAVPYDGRVMSDEPLSRDELRAPDGADVRAKASQVPESRIRARDPWIGLGYTLQGALPDDREQAREIFLDVSFGDRDYNSGVFDTLTDEPLTGWGHLCTLAMPEAVDAVDAFPADPEPPPDKGDLDETNDGGGQSGQLLIIASQAKLFHTGDKTAYADITVNEHRETWPVRSKGFARWLQYEYFKRHNQAPNAAALQSALGVIEARAHYEAPERPICLRVGEHAGNLYLDLGDESWRAIEIGCDGWRVIAEPPVRFRRAAGMLPLPEPARGGSLDILRKLVNVGSDQDFYLAIAWLLATYRPRGPYPVLILAGEQGSAKTTFARILRYLVDPNSAPQRSLPREDRDMFVSANNGHVLSFDNISGLSGGTSDALCRLSTGGGFSVRQLYSDAEETIFEAMRPIIMTGIEDVVSRPDLAERSIFLTLTPIPETSRRTEKALDMDLECARPAILGALLDTAALGLRRLADTKIDRLPRMADFAMWATACGDGSLWPIGGFMQAHEANRAASVNDVIEADSIASAVKNLILEKSIWSGTASDLLIELAERAGHAATLRKDWPGNARALGNKLRRSATALRTIGVNISFTTSGKHKMRMIQIEADAKPDLADAKGSHDQFASAEKWRISAKADAITQKAQNSPASMLADLLAPPVIH